MIKNFRDKVALSGITVLSVGLILLVITFASAFGFLSEALPLFSSQDLVQTFGQTLSPLIEAAIRIMYLGVMGWIGSLVTIRGVTIIANTPKTETAEPQKPKEPQLEKAQPQPQSPKAKAEPKTEPQPEPRPEPKPEAKPAEPELLVIPLEEMEQQNAKPQQ